MFAMMFLAAVTAGFRPPAVPLAVNDPCLSLWSPADRLTDAETKRPMTDIVATDIVSPRASPQQYSEAIQLMDW